MAASSSWFDLLVCPVTKTPLRYDAGRQLLISETAGKAYPIRDGIPVLLADEALEWSAEKGVHRPADAANNAAAADTVNTNQADETASGF